MAGTSNVTDAISFSIIESLHTESVSSQLSGFCRAKVRYGDLRAMGVSPAAVYEQKLGWGLAKFLQSIGAHVSIQSVIPAELRGTLCRALILLPSSQLPYVVKEAQTGTAVMCANEKRVNDLTKILLVISSDQFEVIGHSLYE
jgi:hypothetical protein